MRASAEGSAAKRLVGLSPLLGLKVLQGHRAQGGTMDFESGFLWFWVHSVMTSKTLRMSSSMCRMLGRNRGRPQGPASREPPVAPPPAPPDGPPGPSEDATQRPAGDGRAQ